MLTLNLTTKTDSSYLKVLSIPDLWLQDVASDESFILVGSNKDNAHHVYKVELSDLDNWIDVTPGPDRVLSGTLSHNDLTFYYPKELQGNERFDIYGTDLQTFQNSLVTKLDDLRIWTIKETKDTKFMLFDASSSDKIGLWKYCVQTKKLDLVYSTTLRGNAGSLCPTTYLVPWSEIRKIGSSDYITKIINFGTNEVLKVLDLGEGTIVHSASWSPDGSKLLLLINTTGTDKIGIYDVSLDKISYSKASELELGMEYENLDWISNEEIIYTAKLNGETNLYREIIAKGNPQKIPFAKGTINKLLQSKKNQTKFFIEWSDLSHPEQIIELDIDSLKSSILVDSNLFVGDLAFANYSFIQYPTFDTKWMIPAFEIEPAVHNSDQSPVIVLIHGGPTWEFGNNWKTMANIIHLYSQAGFRVICPNIRGSTGYGRDYQDANIGDLGGADLQDVLYARKYIGEKYPKAHIYVTGASYGGFMTFLLMTKHPGIFKAGAPVVGISDWFEMFRLGDQFFKVFTEGFFKGRPDEMEQLYYDRSAINFVDQLQEPLFIVHRENDSRCPVMPIYTFVGKAVSLGKEVSLFVQKRAGHGSQKMEDLKQQYGGIVTFFLQQENNN